MRKVLFCLISLLCFSLELNAQSITKDIERDGWRIIQTSYETYASTKGLIKGKFKMSLYCECNEEDTVFQVIPEITLGEPSTISKEAKMLIKVKDEEPVLAVSPEGVGTTDYEYQIINGNTFYYIYPAFIIDEDDLLKVIQHDCTKIRIECNWGNGYFDLERNKGYIKKFYFSEIIEELYMLIKDRLKVGNDIYKDF